MSNKSKFPSYSLYSFAIQSWVTSLILHEKENLHNINHHCMKEKWKDIEDEEAEMTNKETGQYQTVEINTNGCCVEQLQQQQQQKRK